MSRIAVGRLVAQVTDLLAVAGQTAILTFIIIKLVGTLVGLRVSKEVEIEGLDAATRCTVDLAA